MPSTWPRASRSRPTTGTATRALEVMDEQGLDAVWLFPTLGVLYEQDLKTDPDAAVVAFRSFNRWLDEDWGFHYQDRIFGAPYITLADVDEAVAELEWALDRGAAPGLHAARRADDEARAALARRRGVRPVLGAGERGRDHRRDPRRRQRLRVQRLRRGRAERRTRPDAVARADEHRPADPRLLHRDHLRPALHPVPEPAHGVDRERSGLPQGSPAQAGEGAQAIRRLLRGGPGRGLPRARVDQPVLGGRGRRRRGSHGTRPRPVRLRLAARGRTRAPARLPRRRRAPRRGGAATGSCGPTSWSSPSSGPSERALAAAGMDDARPFRVAGPPGPGARRRDLGRATAPSSSRISAPTSPRSRHRPATRSVGSGRSIRRATSRRAACSTTSTRTSTACSRTSTTRTRGRACATSPRRPTSSSRASARGGWSPSASDPTTSARGEPAARRTCGSRATGRPGPGATACRPGLVLQAETGMALRLGEPGSAPVSITGRLDEYIGGTFAASAALAAVARAERTGAGSVADVSLFETLLYSLSPVDVVHEFLGGHGIEMAERQRVMPGFVPCADGIGVHQHADRPELARPVPADRRRRLARPDAGRAERRTGALRASSRCSRGGPGRVASPT